MLRLATRRASAWARTAAVPSLVAARHYAATTPPELVFRSPYEDIDIPPLSIDEYVTSGFDAMGSKLALKDVTTGQQVSFAELNSQVSKRALT